MISFEEAEKIALGYINSDCVLLKESIVEKPYGWYFHSQSKKYVETKNISDLLVGSGGFIVEKESGKVIEFGSAFSLEVNFKIYEKGLIGRNDLVVLKVRDINETVRLLNRLRISYVEAKFDQGLEWKIPKIYNEKQLRTAISKQPCVFQNQNFYLRYDEFQKIDESRCFDYELRKHD